VADEVKYYAIVSSGRTAQTPSGIARRRPSADGPFDEALHRDLTWQPDSAIVEWEYGDVGADLVEISEAEAEQLIERFRQKWDAQG
jgi:broad specificity phosphatase PhoE